MSTNPQCDVVPSRVKKNYPELKVVGASKLYPLLFLTLH